MINKIIEHWGYFKLIINDQEHEVKTKTEAESMAEQHGLKLSQFEYISALNKP